MKENKVLRSVLLPKELFEKIQKEANENLSSFNSIVRKIISEYSKNKHK